MKLLITTRADKRVERVTRLTHPMLKDYAKKCGADFSILDGDETPPMNHYRILRFYELFNNYDRIMHLDSDIIIKKDCENLFELVPEDHIGTIFEDKGSRKDHRRALMEAIQKERGDVNWVEGYINTGVFVASKIHQAIFDPNMFEKLWMNFGQDDVELGYRINLLKYYIFELDYKYNFMSMFSEPWNNNESRFGAKIIHYAGNGFFYFMPQHKQIKEDLTLLTKFGEVIT